LLTGGDGWRASCQARHAPFQSEGRPGESAERRPISGTFGHVVEAHAPTTTAELGCLDGTVRPAAETFVPATDEGLLRGDGVFEVVRVYDGRPFALDEHLDRIERSAANLRLGAEVPRAELEPEVPELLEARGGAEFDGCLRVVLTRGGRRLLLTEPLPPSPERARLGFVTYAPTHVLDGIKSLSYAANMLCSRLARERGFDEALLVTPHGRVLEAPTSSVFWAGEDGVLCTPPLDDHILASITRDRVLRLVDVRERPLTMEEVLRAEEVFLASTTREVQSVAVIEERGFPEAGERTREAAAALRDHITAALS
jgi:branched-subunit amino acid aminotransferase/4-amino-4-deoxychorismate lyase